MGDDRISTTSSSTCMNINHLLNAPALQPHVAPLAPVVLVVETLVLPAVHVMTSVVSQCFLLTSQAIRAEMPMLSAFLVSLAVGFATFLTLYIVPPVAFFLFKLGMLYFAIFAAYMLFSIPAYGNPTAKGVAASLFAVACNAGVAWLMNHLAGTLAEFTGSGNQLTEAITKLAVKWLES